MTRAITRMSRARPVPSIWFHPDSEMYTTSAKTTLAVNNDDTVGWIGDSGTDNLHMQNASAPNCPLLKTNVLDGFRVLDYNGTGQGLGRTITARTAYTIFIVARKKSAPSASEDTLLGLRLSTSRTRPITANSGAPYHPNYGFFCNDSTVAESWPTVTPTDWNLLSFTIFSADSAKLRANGGTGSSINPHAILTTATTLSFCVDNTTNYGDYQIAEFQLYPKALDLGDVNYKGKEFKDKYPSLPTWVEAA